MYSCYECESTRDTMNDVRAGCWAIDGVASEKTDAVCHGCYVSRSEESTEDGKGENSTYYRTLRHKLRIITFIISGMFYDIQRRCLTYPQDAEESSQRQIK